MHRRVLTHLELGEVEAERLDLPDQLLQVPVRLPGRPGGGERVLHDAQVGRAAARGRGRRGRRRACASRRSCARAAARCGGAARWGSGSRSPWPRPRPRLQALPQRDEGVARRRGRRVERQTASDAQGGALQAEQHVLAGDAGRLARDGRGDEGVAVAVAADPGAEAHERAHHGRAATGGGALQRVVDAAVHVRHRGEERLVEDGHDRAHLVGGRGLLGAQRRRAPEGVDLLEHAALRAARLGPAADGAVVLLEKRGEPADAGGDRPPSGLGGVRGEDGVEPQALQPLQRGLLADLSGQVREGRGDGVGGILALRTGVALAEDAHALVLLGEVHQVEVAGERAGDLVGALDRERVRDPRGLGERLRRLIGVRLDRGDAQALDVLEEPLGAALAQHTAEQRPEHPHVGAHLLGDLLARLEPSDDVDRLRLRELLHGTRVGPPVGCPRPRWPVAGARYDG